MKIRNLALIAITAAAITGGQIASAAPAAAAEAPAYRPSSSAFFLRNTNSPAIDPSDPSLGGPDTFQH